MTKLLFRGTIYWEGLDFRAEGEVEYPHSVHKLENIVHAPYLHYPVSQWPSLVGKASTKAPKLQCFHSLLPIWEFCGGQPCCWVWVQRPRATWTPAATNGVLPPLGEAASHLYPPLFPFLSSFSHMEKETERSFIFVLLRKTSPFSWHITKSVRSLCPHCPKRVPGI